MAKLKFPHCICICGFILAAGIATQAQSTWNFTVSNAGVGNSLVTWNVAGDLATAPGGVHVLSESAIAFAVNAPGIFADAYISSGTQAISPLDGSYLQYDGADVYTGIVWYFANNTSGGGNDGFGLAAHDVNPRTGDAGAQFLYQPGGQSTVVPIDFSNFNPGTYQSQQFNFNTPITVTLTVVPEPSGQTLLAIGGLALIAHSQQHRRQSPARNEQN
jgi:hypothetical protein